MKTISAQSSFDIVNEKKFTRLMAKLVPEWLQFYENNPYLISSDAVKESAIRQATAQVARDYPDVIQFRVMTTRSFFREHPCFSRGEYRAPEVFRAMFAEV